MIGFRLFVLLLVLASLAEGARRGRSLEDQKPKATIPQRNRHRHNDADLPKPAGFPNPMEKRNDEIEREEAEEAEPGKWKGALKRPIIVKNSIIVNFTTTDPESIKTLIQALRRAADPSRQHDENPLPGGGKTKPNTEGEAEDDWPYDCESVKTDACRTLADAMCSSGSRTYDFPNCEKSFCISKAARCRMLVLMAKSCGAPQNHAVLQREECEEILKGRSG